MSLTPLSISPYTKPGCRTAASGCPGPAPVPTSGWGLHKVLLLTAGWNRNLVRAVASSSVPEGIRHHDFGQNEAEAEYEHRYMRAGGRPGSASPRVEDKDLSAHPLHPGGGPGLEHREWREPGGPGPLTHPRLVPQHELGCKPHAWFGPFLARLVIASGGPRFGEGLSNPPAHHCPGPARLLPVEGAAGR